MNTHIILPLAALVLAAHIATAQDGPAPAQNSELGIGARLTPDGGGFTIKYCPQDFVALEAQLNASGGYSDAASTGPAIVAVGLLEYNIVLPNPSWRVFLGPGLHLGAWNESNYSFDNYTRASHVVFGIDGIAGVEYVFSAIPIGISADLKPALNLTPQVAFFPNNFFGVAVRYYFNHDTMQRKRHK